MCKRQRENVGAGGGSKREWNGTVCVSRKFWLRIRVGLEMQNF